MVVSPPAGRGAQGERPAAPRRAWFDSQRWTWRQWLALGLCFGLGHGITARLLKLRGDEGPVGRQNFGVQPFPGQSLEELRRRNGGQTLPLRADLDAFEQDRRMAREKARADERRGDLQNDSQADQRRTREEAEQTRLESLDRQETPAATPAPAPLPEPIPSAAVDPPSLPAAGPALPPLPQAPPAPAPAPQP